MKLRIEFPEDMAKEKVKEAKEWEEGEPLVWEAEELHAPEQIKRVGMDIVLKTEYTQVTLHKDEVKRIVELSKEVEKLIKQYKGKN